MKGFLVSAFFMLVMMILSCQLLLLIAFPFLGFEGMAELMNRSPFTAFSMYALPFEAAYAGLVMYPNHKRKKREAAEKECLYKLESARRDAEREEENRRSEERAFPVQVGHCKALIGRYEALPDADASLIIQAQAEVSVLQNYREAVKWQSTRIAEQMSYAWWIAQPENKAREAANDFYASRAWKMLRADVLHAWGDDPCCCCKNPLVGAKHVDHIKPRSKFPEMALVKSNLQVMCEDCNMGKGNRHERDWRTEEQRQRLSA